MDELAKLGAEILGQSLRYDRKEVKLAQEVVILKAEIHRLRTENERLFGEVAMLGADDG